MACGCDVGGGRAFTEHLRDGVSGDQVDHQEDERHDHPDDREGVEDALEDGFQGRSLVFVVGASSRR